MARRVFFSFEYDHDIPRVQIVRNSGAFRGIQAAGFIDAAGCEKIKRQSRQVIKRWIDNQLKGTSVTVVLVGSHTCSSDWVLYEIEQSIQRGNGLLGIDISKIPDMENKTTRLCGRILPNNYGFYCWITDRGYKNIGKWIEAAAKAAGKY